MNLGNFCIECVVSGAMLRAFEERLARKTIERVFGHFTIHDI